MQSVHRAPSPRLRLLLQIPKLILFRRHKAVPGGAEGPQRRQDNLAEDAEQQRPLSAPRGGRERPGV